MIRFLLAVLFFFTTAAAAQELRIGLASEPTAMDPHYHNLSPNNSLLSHIFESLVGQDERQRLTPDLAESWKRSTRRPGNSSCARTCASTTARRSPPTT